MNSVAVIMPVYKAHKTIGYSIGSLAKQVGVSYKVYMIVDGEPEGSYDYVKQLYPHLDLGIIYLEKNVGPGAARNMGINVSIEDYIMFVDSDDVLESIFSIGTLVNYMEYTKGIAVVASPFWKQGVDKILELKTNSLTWTHGKLYRREFLDKFGIRFNEEFSYSNEDLGFNTIVQGLTDLEDNTMIMINKPVYVWIDHNESLTRNSDNNFVEKKSLEGFVGNYIYALKHIHSHTGVDENLQNEIIKGIVSIYLNYHGRFEDVLEYQEKLYSHSRLYMKVFYEHIKDVKLIDKAKSVLDSVGRVDEYMIFKKWYTEVKRGI